MPLQTHLSFVRSGNSRRGVTERALLLWFCVAIALIFLVTGSLLLNHAIWSRRVEARIEQLAEAGYPVSIADVRRRHQEGTPEINAADIYEKAFAARQTQTRFDKALLPLYGHAELPKAGDPFSPAMAEEIRQFLDRNAEAIDYFVEASQMAECRFSPTFRPDGVILIPYVGSLRDGARLLSLKAILAAHEGQFSEGVEAIGAIFRIGEHLREDKFLISVLTRSAIAGIALGRLPWVLSSDDLSEGALLRLQEAVAMSGDEGHLAAALPTEVAGGIHYARTGKFFEEPGTRDPLDDARAAGRMAAYRTSGQADRDLLRYLEQVEALIERASIPLEEQPTSRTTPVVPTWRKSLGKGVFVDDYLPNIDRLLDVKKQGIARMRTGLVGVAATRYRLRHGHYPSELAELEGEFLQTEQTINPLTGDVLEYAGNKDDFTITVDGEVILEVERGEHSIPEEGGE